MRTAPSPGDGKQPYYGNRGYYRSQILQAEVALRGERRVFAATADPDPSGWLPAAHELIGAVRYADIKATPGGGSTRTGSIVAWASENRDRLLEVFDPMPGLIVVQGTHAYAAWLTQVKGWVAKLPGATTTMWCAFPHPTPRSGYLREDFRPEAIRLV